MNAPPGEDETTSLSLPVLHWLEAARVWRVAPHAPSLNNSAPGVFRDCRARSAPATHSTLARYPFFTATGRTLSSTETSATSEPAMKAKAKNKAAPEIVPADAPVLIGETAVWRIYLHYRPDEAWLGSPAAAFTRTQAEAIAAASKDTGKQVLVFAAAKFINHRSLRELRVDFAQLPYALHRVQSE